MIMALEDSMDRLDEEYLHNQGTNHIPRTFNSSQFLTIFYEISKISALMSSSLISSLDFSHLSLFRLDALSFSTSNSSFNL